MVILNSGKAAKDRMLNGRSRFAFFIGFCVVASAFGLAVLAQAGVPSEYGVFIVAVMLLLCIAVPGLQARTANPADWLFAGHSAAPPVAGLAISAAVLTGPIVLGLPGLFFAENRFAMAFLIAPLAGLALASILVAPTRNNDIEGSIASMLAARLQSSTVKWLMGLLVAVTSLLFLWAQLRIGSTVAGFYIALPDQWLIVISVCLIAIVVLPGGLFGVTRVNTFLYLFVFAGLATPLAWLAARSTGIPIPQLAHGMGAGADIIALEEQLTAIGLPSLGARVDTGWAEPAFAGQTVILSLFLIAGFVAMPAILVGFQASRTGRARALSGIWSLLFAALILGVAPAAAAFAKIAFYDGFLGITASEIGNGAGWIFQWTARHASQSPETALLTLCGQAGGNVTAVVNACGGNEDYAIGPADLRLHGELIYHALANITQLPASLTALAGAGLYAAALATANAATFAVASVIGVEENLPVSKEKTTEAARLFRSRIIVIVFLAIAGWLATQKAIAPALPGLWALAVSASAIAPVLLLSLWWPRTSSAGALAGMIVPAGVLAAIFILSRIQSASTAPGNEAFSLISVLDGLPVAVQAATFAIPASVITIIGVSLVTARMADPERADAAVSG